MYPCKCVLPLLLALVAATCPTTQAAGARQLPQATGNASSQTAAVAQSYPANCTPPRTYKDTLKPFCSVPNYLSAGARGFLATSAAGNIPWNLDFSNVTALRALRQFYRNFTANGSEAAKAMFLQTVRNDTVAGVPVVFGVPKGANSDSKPANTKLVVYLHGGGYVIGSCEFPWSTVAPTASRADLTIVCVEYRLAPEHPFPAGLNDAVAVYKGLLKQGYQAKNVVLLGDSAGGGMVASVALQLQREGVQPPAALGMFSPLADADPDIPFDTFYTMAAIDPITPLTTPGAPSWGTAYVESDRAKYQDPLVSPRRADWAKIFAGGKLPPTLIQVGLRETLLSQVVLLYHAMKSAAPTPGRVNISPYDGMWHVFQSFFTLPEAEAAHTEMADFFGRAISGTIC